MSKKLVAASMIAYIGTKIVMAAAMTRGEYNEYQGWQIPENEDPADPGYLIEYKDGGTPNHPDHEGYISWSPYSIFQETYRSNGNLSFSDALTLLKRGYRVARKNWNANNQWLSVSNLDTAAVEAKNFWSPHNREYAEQNGGVAIVAPCITIKNAQGLIVMGWVPSQGDLFANDWMTVE